jgi:hypothetical protein
MVNVRRWVGVLLPLVVVVVAAGAQDAALPSGADVLERSIDAMGGRAALEQVRNRITFGSMELPAMGIKAKMVTYTASPNLFYSLVESDAIGRLESGSNGEICWDLTAMTGPRIKTGDEQAAAMREARFNSALHWRELYKDVQTVGIDTVESMPCYKLTLTPAQGDPETQYYDTQSYLLRKVDMIYSTEMGKVPIQTTVSDYRQADGILLPFKVRQLLMSVQEMIFVTDSVAQNVEIPADRFALPPDIQALADKAAQGAQTPSGEAQGGSVPGETE